MLKQYAVMQGTGNLDSIQVIKKLGGGLQDSYLDEGMLIVLLSPYNCVKEYIMIP